MNCPRCGMPCWFAPKWNQYGCVDDLCAWTSPPLVVADFWGTFGQALKDKYQRDEAAGVGLWSGAPVMTIGAEWARTIEARDGGSLWAHIAIVRRPGVPLRVDRDFPRNMIMGVAELWPLDPRD